jgi:hypothetical protein
MGHAIPFQDERRTVLAGRTSRQRKKPPVYGVKPEDRLSQCGNWLCFAKNALIDIH